MTLNLPDVLKGIKTVQDTQRFGEMNEVDQFYHGYRAGFASVNAEILKGGIIERLGIALGLISPKKESEMSTTLVDHVCVQCEYALRISDERHILFRYLPVKNSKTGDKGLTGEFDPDKEIIATICAIGSNPYSEYVQEKYKNAPIIFTPTIVCPSASFVKRK